MSAFTIDIDQPKEWDKIAHAINAHDLSIGETLWVARVLVETSVSEMDAETRRLVLIGFARAIDELTKS